MAFVKIAPLPERKARVALLKTGANPKKCPSCGATYTGTVCKACGYNEKGDKVKTSPSKAAMESRKEQERDLGKGYGGKD